MNKLISKINKILKLFLPKTLYLRCFALYHIIFKRRRTQRCTEECHFLEKKWLSTKEKYISIAHISALNYVNWGDTILAIALRSLFEENIKVDNWESLYVGKIVDEKLCSLINTNDALVIGGGGLFLKDTNPNNISGWQWPCSQEMLEHIKVPIIMWAVGYNRFRNQDDFEDIFKNNINAFIEKASFIGLRNNGSINAIKPYLRDDLKHKLMFQPCMTTIMNKIYPRLFIEDAKRQYIGINCAFDREDMRRFTEQKKKNIACALKKISKYLPIRVYAHIDSDFRILPYLDKENVKYEAIKIESPLSCFNEYTNAALVIGMRGHAQMIPFGCGTPILSIISHDKMQWFLDDIGYPEWGCELSQDNFQEMLVKKTENVLNSIDTFRKEILIAQDKIYKITLKNLHTVSLIIGEKNG